MNRKYLLSITLVILTMLISNVSFAFKANDVVMSVEKSSMTLMKHEHNALFSNPECEVFCNMMMSCNSCMTVATPSFIIAQFEHLTQKLNVHTSPDLYSVDLIQEQKPPIS